MRTTLDIDDDVLRAARSLARSNKKTIGEVVSELARRSLRPIPPRNRRGFPIFPVGRDATPLTPEMVRQTLEEE